MAGGLSYSACVKSTEMFPKRDQAIVFPLLEDLTNEQYAEAIGSVISPSKIIFQSRMSKERMCFYFDSVNTLNSFMQEHGKIVINDQTLEARHLVNPLKQLTISNVCPIIPHTVIVNEIVNQTGLAVKLPMRFIKAGHTKPSLQHILSFRRAIQYEPDNTENIPDSIVINYENEEFRIFLSTESNMKCFLCKQNGHPARKCPMKIEPRPEQNNIPKVDTKDNPINETNCNKRDSSALTSTEKFVQKKRRKRTKKSKKPPPGMLTRTEIKTIENYLDDHPEMKKENPFISKKDFIKLLHNLDEPPNAHKYARQYTQDLEALSPLLGEIMKIVPQSTGEIIGYLQEDLMLEEKLEQTTSEDEQYDSTSSDGN